MTSCVCRQGWSLGSVQTVQKQGQRSTLLFLKSELDYLHFNFPSSVYMRAKLLQSYPTLCDPKLWSSRRQLNALLSLRGQPPQVATPARRRKPECQPHAFRFSSQAGRYCRGAHADRWHGFADYYCFPLLFFWRIIFNFERSLLHHY